MLLEILFFSVIGLTVRMKLLPWMLLPEPKAGILVTRFQENPMMGW